MISKVKKQRQRKRSPLTKLKREDVIDIRQSKAVAEVAAKHYKVSTSTVLRIRQRLLWKHVA